jgi:ABC-2 type transport system permease protein
VSSRRLLVHQVRLEQRAFWRNPDTAFFTFLLPIGLLLIFGATTSGDVVHGRPHLHALTLFVPGILAFGIIVAAYGSLAATVTVLRSDGVLKRIRATPLDPRIYISGQLLSVLTTSLLIALTTVVLGRLAFGVAPRLERVAPLLVTLSLGILCFAALGLAVSAFISSASAAGPVTNGTYLPLALVSGTFNANMRLPAWLDRVVGIFPIKALTMGLRAGYDPAAHAWSPGYFVVLAVWAVGGTFLAVRYFRWDS